MDSTTGQAHGVELYMSRLERADARKRIGDSGVELSVGQKQRITLARTLLKDPSILILDDATSSVDMETEAAIRDALLQLMPGRTTFIIAHRIQTVMNADLVYSFTKPSRMTVDSLENLHQNRDFLNLFAGQRKISYKRSGESIDV